MSSKSSDGDEKGDASMNWAKLSLSARFNPSSYSTSLSLIPSSTRSSLVPTSIMLLESSSSSSSSLDPSLFSSLICSFDIT